MENKHFGQRYEYLIDVDFINFYFDIYSKHIETNTVSIITNLNFILSEFGDYHNQNDCVDESTWIIRNFMKLKNIWKKANATFEDTDFVFYLEKQLDIDREYGGWNSDFHF